MQHFSSTWAGVGASGLVSGCLQQVRHLVSGEDSPIALAALRGQMLQGGLHQDRHRCRDVDTLME